MIKTLVNHGKIGITVQVPQQQSNDINTAQISHNNQEEIPPLTKKRYGSLHLEASIIQCNFWPRACECGPILFVEKGHKSSPSTYCVK